MKRDNDTRRTTRLALPLFVAIAMMMVGGAASADSSWDCFRNDGRLMGRVAIRGNLPADATGACNQWISYCNGRCAAVGCDIKRQRDAGCRVPLNDTASNAHKEIFKAVCNAHDECYHAPWDRISDFLSGFDQCNDNFWNDMNSTCDRAFSGDGPRARTCRTVASMWADVMNFFPGRISFLNSFKDAQDWMNRNCAH